MRSERYYSIIFYTSPIMGLVLWFLFGWLSQRGIFSFGLDFGFQPFIRTIFNFISLTSLVIAVSLGPILFLISRKKFPKANKEFNEYLIKFYELKKIQRIGLLIFIGGVLTNLIILLILAYMIVITNQYYNYEILSNIMFGIATFGMIIFIIFIDRTKEKKNKETDSNVRSSTN